MSFEPMADNFDGKPDRGATNPEIDPRLKSFFGKGNSFSIRRAGQAIRHQLSLGLGFAVTAYARMFGSVDVESRHLKVTTPHWPEGKELRIGLIADFHAGSPHMTMEKLDEVIDRTNATRPDVILMLGDYLNQSHNTDKGEALTVNGEVVPPEAVAEKLSRLEAPGGVFAVLGNHDWYFHGPEMREALKGHGVTVLENDAVQATVNGQTFWIGGMEDHSQNPDYGPIHDKVGDDPHIVITHNPVDLEQVDTRAAFMTAGHTHGGQVAIKWLERLAHSPIVQKIAELPALKSFLGDFSKELDEHTRWPYGHRVVDGKDSYVTSGLGTSTVPLRVNMPPEVVTVDIKGGERDQEPERAGTPAIKRSGPAAIGPGKAAR